MNTASSTSKNPIGFTLIELLVVIAIIAVLASLVFPALGKAKAKAQSLHCSNNLQQLQLALQAYTDDHQGRYPENFEGKPFGFWQSMAGSWVTGNAQRDRSPRGIQRGVLWPYIGELSLYHCPTDRSTILRSDTIRRLRSYSMSTGIIKAFLPGSGVGAAEWTIQNENRVRATSTLSGFVDTSEDSIDTGTFVIRAPSRSKNVRLLRWSHLPSDRHNGGANVSFLDGHVDHHKWLQTPKVKVGESQRPVNRADLQDLIWMAESKPWAWWEPGIYNQEL